MYHMYMINCGLTNQDVGGIVKRYFEWLANVFVCFLVFFNGLHECRSTSFEDLLTNIYIYAICQNISCLYWISLFYCIDSMFSYKII